MYGPTTAPVLGPLASVGVMDRLGGGGWNDGSQRDDVVHDLDDRVVQRVRKVLST